MKRVLACVVLGALVLLGCAKGVEQTTEGFDWPCWRGPDGNGISRETDWDPQALDGGPRVLWKADVGMGYSNVAIHGGRLYAMGRRAPGVVVCCLDAGTGAEIWRHSWEDVQPPQAAPSVDERSVYVLSFDGVLRSLDARTGKLRWQKDLVSQYGAVRPFYGFAGSPMVDGALLILNANTAGMALKKSNGRLVWGSEAPPADRLRAALGDDNGATYMTPVLYDSGGKRCALLYSWKGLYSVMTETGRAQWLYEWEHYNLAKTPDPVLLEDGVFIADENGVDYSDRFCTLLKIDHGRPVAVWKSPELYSDVGTPIVLDGYIYDSHGGPYSGSPWGTLRCVKLATGDLMWEASVEELYRRFRPNWISLTAAAGRLVVLTDHGSLHIAEASPEGFRVISSCDVLGGENKPRKFYTPPVLCNGRIYCRNFSGDLICIDVSKRSP